MTIDQAAANNKNCARPLKEMAVLYVERNINGEIISIRKDEEIPGLEKKLTVDNEILEFLGKTASQDSILQLLARMDTEIVRILEDLIDLLVKKNVIMFTELPDEAQEKLHGRRQIRQQINKESLLIDDTDVL